MWLNAFAVKQVPDAAVYTTLKNAVAAVVETVTAPFVQRADVRRIERPARVALVAVGILGGGIGFLLFFSGLAMASAPSAAFIQKTMFVWVAILAVPFLGERLGFVQIAALAVLAVGQALVLPPRGIAWGTGETLILLATLCWTVEVVLVRLVLVGSPARSSRSGDSRSGSSCSSGTSPCRVGSVASSPSVPPPGAGSCSPA